MAKIVCPAPNVFHFFAVLLLFVLGFPLCVIFFVFFLFSLVFLCLHRPKSKHLFLAQVEQNLYDFFFWPKLNGSNSNKPAGLSRIGLSRVRPSGIKNRVSLFFHDPDLLSSYDSTYVPHQDLVSSSSRKPSTEIGMLRNTRDDRSILGNIFDGQHARRAPDESHNDSRTLATFLGVLRTEGIEKSESEEPLQSTPFSCSSVRARQKSLIGGECPVFLTNRVKA